VIVDKNIEVLGLCTKVREAIDIEIEIGDINADVRVYVVDKAPADILLGIPFLSKYSEGFKKMIQEFSKNYPGVIPPGRETVCAAEDDELLSLLEEFPNLVIDEDKVPDATRYYKGRTFTLGLPKDKRDKIYFRAQYPPNPQEIEKYRELVQPLVDSGVYRVSSSLHNNPVMLVPKSTPVSSE